MLLIGGSKKNVILQLVPPINACNVLKTNMRKKLFLPCYEKEKERREKT